MDFDEQLEGLMGQDAMTTKIIKVLLKKSSKASGSS